MKGAGESKLSGGRGSSSMSEEPKRDDEEAPPLNPLFSSMLTDISQVNQAYAYWTNGRAEQLSTFEVCFRKNPFGGEYTVFAGLDECVKLLSTFKFKEEHVTFLRNQPVFSQTQPDFWKWLAGVDCKKVLPPYARPARTPSTPIRIHLIGF